MFQNRFSHIYNSQFLLKKGPFTKVLNKSIGRSLLSDITLAERFYLNPILLV